MPTHCTGQVLRGLHCLSQKLKCALRFSLQFGCLWTVKHRAVNDIRRSWCMLLLRCVETSQVKTIQLSVLHQSLAQRCHLFLVHWFVCFHMYSFITTQSTHNSDWMNTNWNSSLPHMKCFSLMPQQSNPCIPLPSGILFPPTHHSHIVAFTLAALNHTRDKSNNGLSFAALSASPIVCFSSSSSSFTRYSAASVQQQWVSNMKMET